MTTSFKRALAAIIFMIAGTLFMSLSSVLTRLLSSSYTMSQILIFRMMFCLVVIMLFAHLILKQKFWFTKKPALHALRCVVGILIFLTYITSLYFLPVAQVSALTLTEAIFVAILSTILLKEKHGLGYWMVIILGFLGAVIALKPDPSIFNPLALIPLLGGFLFAVNGIVIGMMAKSENFGNINFYFTITSLTICLILSSFQWLVPQSWPVENRLIGWQPVLLQDVLVLMVMGLCAAISQLLMTQSYRLGRASLVTPFFYLDLPISAALGFFILHERIDLFLITGGAIIIVSGLAILYLEKQQKKQP